MRITVIGSGNVGGGLAERWRRAGHEVTELGREGGDASAADVLLVAVPGEAVADALANVRGTGGKTTIDATNAVRGRDESFPSVAHQVKSIVGGPTAKSFNLNFARIYDRIDAEPAAGQPLRRRGGGAGRDRAADPRRRATSPCTRAVSRTPACSRSTSR